MAWLWRSSGDHKHVSNTAFVNGTTGAHLDVLRVLSDDSSRNALSITDDLGDTPRHIGRAILSLWCLLRHNNKIGHDMSSDLVIGQDQGSVELEEGVQGRTGDQR